MSVLCCNPINVDDDVNDKELEEIWEYQRNKNMARASQPQKTGRRRFGMGRKKPPMAAQAPMRNAGRRAQSAGRMGRNRFEDDDDSDRYNKRANSVGRLDQRRGREMSRRQGGIRTQARQVSISRYVERIDIPPPVPKRNIAPPMSRGRSRSVSVGARGRSRSRSSSIGRRKPQRSRSKKRLFGWGRKNKQKRDEGFSSDESSIGSWSADSRDDDTYF